MNLETRNGADAEGLLCFVHRLNGRWRESGRGCIMAVCRCGSSACLDRVKKAPERLGLGFSSLDWTREENQTH